MCVVKEQVSKVAFSKKKDPEEEWKAFQEGVLSSSKEVCGLRKLGGRR